MPEFLRDPFWQFAGAVFALAAIAVSVVLYCLQRRRKALSYETTSRTRLMSVAEEVKGRVQIVFDGTPVSDVHMVVIRVTNSGNVPIRPSDFLRPVKFGFGETVQILSAEIIETNPDNVEASLESDSDAVVLRPVLLNGGDTVTFNVLLAQFPGRIDVDGRIVGVKQIRMARETPVPLRRVGLFVGVAAEISAAGFLFGFLFALLFGLLSAIAPTGVEWLLSAVTAGLAGGLVAFVFRNRIRRIRRG